MLPNTISILIATAGVTIGVLGIMIGAIPFLKKKGVDVDKTIKDLNTKGELIEGITDQLKPVLPKKVVNVIDLIEKWAPIAAGKAEQMVHAGEIGKDDRATTAEDVVLSVLKEAEIEVDENKKKLIDAAIKNAVNDFGHAPKDVKQIQAQAEATQKQLQSEKEQIQAQLSQVQNENAQLKQTIASVQATLQPTQ